MPVSETGCRNGGAGDLLWTPAGIPVGPAPVPPLRGPEALRGSERPDPTPAGRKAGGTHGRSGEGAVTPTIAAPAASLLRSVSTLSQSTFAVHAARDSPSPPRPRVPPPTQATAVWLCSGCERRRCCSPTQSSRLRPVLAPATGPRPIVALPGPAPPPGTGLATEGRPPRACTLTTVNDRAPRESGTKAIPG